MSKKQQPQNPILPEHEEKFEAFLQKWLKLLNLSDWRLLKKRGRPSGVLAQVLDIESEHRVARYQMGRDAGVTEVTDEMLESLAIHEALHIRNHVMLETACAEGEYNDHVMAEEHAAINVIEQLLLRLAKMESLAIDLVIESK